MMILTLMYRFYKKSSINLDSNHISRGSKNSNYLVRFIFIVQYNTCISFINALNNIYKLLFEGEISKRDTIMFLKKAGHALEKVEVAAVAVIVICRNAGDNDGFTFSDGETWPLRKLLEPLWKCVNLNGKPKIILTNYCRGPKFQVTKLEESYVHDEVITSNLAYNRYRGELFSVIPLFSIRLFLETWLFETNLGRFSSIHLLKTYVKAPQ